MSNLPPNPYDRTVVMEANPDNPDRSSTVGSGRDFVALLSNAPGASQQFLARNGQWFTFGTTELTSWGNIMGDITDQADLMAMFALYTPTTGYAPVAFTGNYNDLINKPPLGTVSPINLDGLTSHFLRGDGQWAIPQDVYATWGQISGTITDQADLMAMFASKANINSPVFTGTPSGPTPPLNDNSTRFATTAWFFGQAFNGVPAMNGVASSGASTLWARGDHRHPSDTTKIDDAPNDGATYGRNSQAWVRSVWVQGDTMTGPLVLPLGTAAATSLNFGTPGTGFFATNISQLNIATGGVQRIALTTTILTTTVPVRAGNGSVAAPTYSFTSDTGSGLYRSALNTLSMATNGTEAMRWLADNSTQAFGPVTLPGAPTAPLHAATKAYVDAATGALTPPPSDGNTYGYKNGAWVILDLGTKWDKA